MLTWRLPLESQEAINAPAEEANRPQGEDLPPLVTEEESLLKVVLAKLDKAEPKNNKTRADDVGAMIELRDALAEAKPEDHASLLEQMHRIEALSRQRGKGDSVPVDRRSPYFGHLRMEENGKRRDVLIGQRGFVEAGGGVQIVDWRNAPVSRIFYRYDEGDSYEEQIGNRVLEGEILARRTVTITESKLRRVASSTETHACDGLGRWRKIDTRTAKLHVQRDGSASYARPGDAQVEAHGSVPRGKLGGDSESAAGRSDRFLPAIAAMIDPRQFDLISRPTSGLIVVQGSAGSGKTTIGLHRIAYLAFTEPGRFKPENMLIVVYQRALANYVSRVLPSLEVPGVPVMTFAVWAEKIRQMVVPSVDASICEHTPSVVIRMKSHGAMLRILQDRQVLLADACRQQIESGLNTRPAAREALLRAWDETQGPVDCRVSRLAMWVRDARLDGGDKMAIETLGKALRRKTRDVVGEWASLLTDRGAMANGFARYAPDAFSQAQLDGAHAWCVERERLRQLSSDGVDDEKYTIDAEDDALLLRIFQLQRGPLASKRGPVIYEHMMVDEVQDFAPIELAVLLDSVSPARSITLAGDTAQAIAPEHGFSRWSDMLDDLGIPHDKVEPLKVSYRSTKQIVDCAEHVLGPLAGDARPVAPRSGSPVESFPFGSSGEAIDFLSKALKDLVREDPHAAVAVIARHQEQARAYYQGLRDAEVPRLRLVADQDFSFVAGIDVTDVRQTKGLEFDIVILLEVNEDSYPDNEHSRRLLHVATTRAAHQVWVTFTGKPSLLLPDELK